MTTRVKLTSFVLLLSSFAICVFLDFETAAGQSFSLRRKGNPILQYPFLLNETFKEGREHWVALNDGEWKIVDEDGNKFLQLKDEAAATQRRRRNAAPKPDNVCWLEGLNLTDFDVKLKVRCKAGESQRGVCICWGHSHKVRDDDRFYFAHLGITAESCRISLFAEDKTQDITTNKANAVAWTNDWHTIHVQRRTKDGLIHVYFDDMETPVLIARNKVFTKGLIGIGTLGQDAAFDDIDISGYLIRGGDHNDGALPPRSTYVDRMYARVPTVKMMPKTQMRQGIEFCRVPAGSFIMGSKPDEFRKHDSEAIEEKLHLVDLSEFWISAHEITQGKYEEVMGENPSRCEPLPNDDWREGEDLSQHPVQSVNWYQALLFCNRLSEQDDRTPCYTIKDVEMYPPPNSRYLKQGMKPWIRSAHVSFSKEADGYRLPSDAEWEYACRAGTTTTFAFGIELTSKQGNFGKEINHTTKVGSYPPNRLGIFDMHGNVYEWCHDIFREHYSVLPRENPMPLPTQFYSTETSTTAVNYRGGCYRSDVLYCRSANRDGVTPSSMAHAKAECCGTFGIRVVLPSKSIKTTQ